MLKFDGAWRFEPPPDGKYKNKTVSLEALADFNELIRKMSTQGDRWDILEHFKGAFCGAVGSTHVRSSNESWAESDLDSYMRDAGQNAPLFLEAFYDGCQALADSDGFYVPPVTMINSVCRKHDIGYEIRPPQLVLLENELSLVPVQVEDHSATLAEEAMNILRGSLQRAEHLLAENRPREAVQEILWLLESVSTAFRGIEMPTKQVVGGRYFNQIAKELRNGYQGTTLERVLDWVLTLHGFLSSPTGGGIRHGIDLNRMVEIGQSEGRLFCNLVRSYISYLLSQYETARQGHGVTEDPF
jgi:hypothetical protein